MLKVASSCTEIFVPKEKWYEHIASLGRLGPHSEASVLHLAGGTLEERYLDYSRLLFQVLPTIGAFCATPCLGRVKETNTKLRLLVELYDSSRAHPPAASSIFNLPDVVVFVKIVLSPSFKVIPPIIKESKFKRYLLLGRYKPAEIF